MERCRIERGKDGIIKKADRRYVERAVNEKIDTYLFIKRIYISMDIKHINEYCL